jgi:uncharacterized protein (DUF736 family)
MAFEEKDNSGIAFPNDYKQSEKHPDYRGNIIVNGQKLEIAIWKKQGKKGGFLSLSFQERRERKPDLKKPESYSQTEVDPFDF